MWEQQVFDEMPIRGLPATSDLCSQLAIEMEKDFSNLVFLSLDALKDKCRKLGTFDQVIPSATPGICNFLMYNRSLPVESRYSECPLSGFTEGFVMFTEKQLVNIVSSYRLSADGIAGRRVLREFMVSRSTWRDDNDNVPTQQEVHHLLNDVEHVTFFIIFILYNPRIVKSGYARQIRSFL